jgi:hypothetical protein
MYSVTSNSNVLVPRSGHASYARRLAGFAVFADSRNAFAVGAPFSPRASRIFSSLNPRQCAFAWRRYSRKDPRFSHYAASTHFPRSFIFLTMPPPRIFLTMPPPRIFLTMPRVVGAPTMPSSGMLPAMPRHGHFFHGALLRLATPAHCHFFPRTHCHDSVSCKALRAG